MKKYNARYKRYLRFSKRRFYLEFPENKKWYRLTETFFLKYVQKTSILIYFTNLYFFKKKTISSKTILSNMIIIEF